MDGEILVSTIADERFESMFHNQNIKVFKSFDEILELIETTPLRISKLFITEDVTRYNPNPSFTSLVKLLESIFFKTEEIIFITPLYSDSVKRIEFLQQEGLLKDITIIKGKLQKEFIASVIRGDTGGKPKIKRKEVIRHRRSEYINEHRQNDFVLNQDEHIYTEEEKLKKINNQPVTENHIYTYAKNGELIQVTGLNNIDNAVFAIVLAQFISGGGKTIFIETDTVYFTASYLLKQGNIKYENIPLNLFYIHPLDFINKIKDSNENLICITGTSEDKDKQFQVYNIINSLYNMMRKEIDYFIFQTGLNNILPSLKNIAVIENDILSSISTAHKIPSSCMENIMFSALDRAVEGIAIKDSSVLSSIVSEILDRDIQIPIYNIKSLELGDESYDLHRYVSG